MSYITLLLTVSVCFAAATHNRRLPEKEIAALQRNWAKISAMCNNPNGCSPETAESKVQRAEIKQLFTQQLVGIGKKHSDAEHGAEEWLQAIQEAKRAVHRSMGIGNIEPRDNGLWQGDILLTRKQAEAIIADRDGKKHKRSIMTDTAKKWTSPIQYYIDPTVTAPTSASIDAAIQQIQSQFACNAVVFQKITSKPASGFQYMHFVMDGTTPGCKGRAYIGYQSSIDNVVAVNLDADFCQQDGCGSNSVAVHEVYHALGYSHEHCRFDRDNYVYVNMSNVDPSDTSNFENFAIDSTTEFNAYGQKYNYASVMHYQSNLFARGQGLNTMTAVGGTPEQNTANTNLMGNSCSAQAADIYLGKQFYCS